MTLVGVLKPAMNAVMHLYLVTHGVSVPRGSEPGDLARSIWSLTFGSLASWLGAWLTTPLLSFLPRL